MATPQERLAAMREELDHVIREARAKALRAVDEEFRLFNGLAQAIVDLEVFESPTARFHPTSGARVGFRGYSPYSSYEVFVADLLGDRLKVSTRS